MTDPKPYSPEELRRFMDLLELPAARNNRVVGFTDEDGMLSDISIVRLLFTAYADGFDADVAQVAIVDRDRKLAMAVKALIEIAHDPHSTNPPDIPYDVGVQDGHRCAAVKAREALEEITPTTNGEG